MLLHETKPETATPLSPKFIFTKLLQRVENLESNRAYHLIYFDAFSPDKAPKLWTGAVFESIYHKMTPGGISSLIAQKVLSSGCLGQSGFGWKHWKALLAKER